MTSRRSDETSVKKTETRVRVYEDGKLTSETTTTVVEKAGKAAVPIGFQIPAGGDA